MSNLPLYTAFTASALMLMQLALMLMVGLSRGKYQQTIGDGANPQLLLSIRRHGNLTENAPIFLILLALAEIIAGSTSMVLALGAAFVAVRIAHAIGLTMGAEANAPRVIGAFGTLLCGAVLSAYLCYATFATLAATAV